VQQKIVYAGRVAASFAHAAELLNRLAQLPVPTKQVERLTRAIGAERLDQRDAAVAAFVDRPLVEKFDAPTGVAPPDLACVFVDGGRLQIRERTDQAAEPVETPAEQQPWEPEPVAAKGHWREDKIGLLTAMKSASCACDPCPEIPPWFLDVLRMPILAKELGKVAATAEEVADTTRARPTPAATESAYEAPEVEQRRVAASCRPWPVFALVVAQAAHAAGFQKAGRKAFVADGAANNWRLRERFFGSFVAVLDFIHALS
jgi:hypothetical protein